MSQRLASRQEVGSARSCSWRSLTSRAVTTRTASRASTAVGASPDAGERPRRPATVRGIAVRSKRKQVARGSVALRSVTSGAGTRLARTSSASGSAGLAATSLRRYGVTGAAGAGCEGIVAGMTGGCCGGWNDFRKGQRHESEFGFDRVDRCEVHRARRVDGLGKRRHSNRSRRESLAPVRDPIVLCFGAGNDRRRAREGRRGRLRCVRAWRGIARRRARSRRSRTNRVA